MRGFKLICLDCGKEIIIDDNHGLDNKKASEITGFLQMTDEYEINCKCGNKIFLE